MNNWISILEQLPDTEQEIIIYFKNKAGWHVSTAYWDGDSIVEICERCGFKKAYLYDAIVTHWMALPQKPIT
jgi:hypothetical protein